jgi:hypothetical protein
VNSVFKTPDASVMTGLASAALVLAIYSKNMPNGANVRANPKPDDQVLETMRKASAFESIGVLGTIFLLTRDWPSFKIGALTLTGVDLFMKFHNSTDPATNKAAPAAIPGSVKPVPAAEYSPVVAAPQQYSSEDAMDWAS